MEKLQRANLFVTALLIALVIAFGTALRAKRWCKCGLYNTQQEVIEDKPKFTTATTIRGSTWADMLNELTTNRILLTLQPDGSVKRDMIPTNSIIDFTNFCAVRGHIWGAHLHVTLEYNPNRIACRECKVCGLHQEQYATDWK